MSHGTDAERQRQADLIADDLSPTCPHCGNLCDHHAVICVECGTRLYDRRPTPEDDERG